MAERYYYTADGIVFPGPSGADKEPYPQGWNGVLPASPPGNSAYIAGLNTPQESLGLYQAIQVSAGDICTPRRAVCSVE